MYSCTHVVLIHELIKIPNYTHVFHNNEIHNNESTHTDISTLLMTLSSLGISISTILCYSSYFGLTESNYFCFSLAFSISFHYQFWWMDFRLLPRVLLSSSICPAPVSLINIHKPCLSVYIWMSEILYIVNIQKYKLRMLTNTPNIFFNTLIIHSTIGNFRLPHLTCKHVYN